MPNSRFVAPFSESQLKAAAIVPKVAAFPSILGSLFIIQHVLRSKKRRGRVYHRILLLMSVNDLVYSFKAFISTWPQPRDTPDWLSYGSVGNAATCTAAGFLGHGSALTSIVYNLSLTIFFLMVVRYGWKESQIKKRVEFWLHFVPFLVGWSTATAGLFLKLFNAFGWTCWINSYPLGCTDNVDCERGDNAGIYRWAFFHAELWTCYAFILLSMVLIYYKIADQEKAMDKYTFRSQAAEQSKVVMQETKGVSHPISIQSDHDENENENELEPTEPLTTTTRVQSKERIKIRPSMRTKRSTTFAIQATFYVAVFFITWFVPMLQAVFSVNSDTLYFPLILLASILSSLQGFSNAAIYLRPRWIEFRRQHPSFTRLEALQCALRLRDPGEVGNSKLSDLGRRPYVSSLKDDDITFEPKPASDPRVSAISALSFDGVFDEGEPQQLDMDNSTKSSNDVLDSGYMF